MTSNKQLINIITSFFNKVDIKEKNIDWIALTDIAFRNRVLPLVYRYLKTNNLLKNISEKAAVKSRKTYNNTLANTILYEKQISQILEAFNRSRIQVMLMRGMYLAEYIYPDPGTRPFSDIDILVERRDVLRSARIVRSLGYTLPHKTLPEEYYMRNHLHVWYVKRKENSSCELHWNIDHEYTDYLIDVAGMFRRAATGDIAGIKSCIMDVHDRLLSLAIHFQKHCNYIKYFWDHPWIVDVVIKRGDLIYAVDLYFFIKKMEKELKINEITKRAKDWNLHGVAFSTLHVVKNIFDYQYLSGILEELHPPKSSVVEKRTAHLFFNEFRQSETKKSRRIKGFSMKMFFGLSRLLDLFGYFFPGNSYLQKRYNRRGSISVLYLPIAHFFVAASELSRNIVDYMRFGYIGQKTGRSEKINSKLAISNLKLAIKKQSKKSDNKSQCKMKN